MSHLKFFNPAEELQSGPSSRQDANSAATSLLADLESRQDHVLAELDLLNNRIEDVLRELGVTLDGSDEEVEKVPAEHSEHISNEH